MLKTTWNAIPPGWTHSHLREISIYNEEIRSPLKNSEPGGGYHFVGCAAVANQRAAAWMWLAGAIPLGTVHSNPLLYLMLFCETHDLVWEIISVSEKAGLCSTHESWVKFDSTLTQMSRVRVESAMKIKDLSRVRVESRWSSFESELSQLDRYCSSQSWVTDFLKRKR